MSPFFFVTDMLFLQIKQILLEVCAIFSLVASGASLVLCIIITVRFVSKGINKQNFIKNKQLTFITLLLELIASLFATNKIIIKINTISLLVCLIIIFCKGVFNSKEEKNIEIIKIKESKNSIYNTEKKPATRKRRKKQTTKPKVKKEKKSNESI